MKLTKKNLKRLRFLDTPEHGYLIVSIDIIDKYPSLKEQISTSGYSWIDGDFWYLEEDADTTMFFEELQITEEEANKIKSIDIGIKCKNCRYSKSYDDRGNQICPLDSSMIIELACPKEHFPDLWENLKYLFNQIKEFNRR